MCSRLPGLGSLYIHDICISPRLVSSHVVLHLLWRGSAHRPGGLFSLVRCSMCYTLEEPAAPVLEEPEEPAPKKPHPVVALRELSASWRSLLLRCWRSLPILLRRSQVLVHGTPHPPSIWSLESHECRKCVVYNCSQCVDIGVVLCSCRYTGLSNSSAIHVLIASSPLSNYGHW